MSWYPPAGQPAPGGWGAPQPAPGGWGAPPPGQPAPGGWGAPPPAASGWGAPPPAAGGWGAPPPGQPAAPGGWGAPPPGQPAAPGGWGAPPPGQPAAPGGWGAPPPIQGPPGGFQAPPGGAVPGRPAPPPPGGGSFAAPSGGGGGGGGGSFAGPPRPSASVAGTWYGALYNQMSQQELTDLWRWFQNIDRDNSGTISPVELQNLAFGGKPLGLDTAVKLTRVFDRDRSGTIEFPEYATLHKFITSMQTAFSQTDSDRSGTLDQQEIVTALRVAGFDLSLQAVQAVHRKYNKHGVGVTFPDFLAMAADIALLRTQFERLDQARSGVIHIDLNTLIAVASEV